MGLRSRRRRLAGISNEHVYDVEELQNVRSTLKDHIDVSRKQVDDFNLKWKTFLGYVSLALVFQSAIVWYQTMVEDSITASEQLQLSLVEVLAVASLLTTKDFVLTGKNLPLSLATSFSHIVLYVICTVLLGNSFLPEIFPLPFVYAVSCWFTINAIGSNTKTEIARAQQLEKLQRVLETEYAQ